MIFDNWYIIKSFFFMFKNVGGMGYVHICAGAFVGQRIREPSVGRVVGTRELSSKKGNHQTLALCKSITCF